MSYKRCSLPHKGNPWIPSTKTGFSCFWGVEGFGGLCKGWWLVVGKPVCALEVHGVTTTWNTMRACGFCLSRLLHKLQLDPMRRFLCQPHQLQERLEEPLAARGSAPEGNKWQRSRPAKDVGVCAGPELCKGPGDPGWPGGLGDPLVPKLFWLCLPQPTPPPPW